MGGILARENLGKGQMAFKINQRTKFMQGKSVQDQGEIWLRRDDIRRGGDFLR